MKYVIDYSTLDSVLHPYFDILLIGLHPVSENNNEGWKVDDEYAYVFMYSPEPLESKLDYEDRVLYYWGAFFESAEKMFNLNWEEVKDSLSRYLRKKGFKFRKLS